MNLFAFNTIQILLLVQLGDSVSGVIFSLIWNVHNSTSYSGRSTNPVTTQKYCTKDRHCDTGYCHKHYGICHECKTIGKKCRRDHVCCKGFECVFGSCRKVVQAGDYMSRCRKDKHDCNKGLCCVKSHGEFVCKYKLKRNNNCEVFKGGVDNVNHNCPCDDGLVCMRRMKLRKKRVKGMKLKTEMRCQKITF